MGINYIVISLLIFKFKVNVFCCHLYGTLLVVSVSLYQTPLSVT